MLVHIYQQTQEIFMFRKLENVKKKGKGLLLGKNSPFNNIPIIGAIL